MSATSPEQINPESLIIIQEPGFLAVVWTCVGVSFLFIAFRAYVRLRVFGKFLADDFFVLLAWLILLTCTILWHVRKTLDLVYLSFLVGYGAVAPPPYYIEHLVNWLRILFAELLLNMLGIWSIKFSFLVFFRKLSENIRAERILWWIVTALTVAALAISIGVTYYPCIFATFEFETTFCPTPKAGAAIYRSYRIQFGCDFASDFIIMLIPVKLLWKVQMSLRRKLGILGLFFLIAVTMVFSLVRVVVGLRGPREDDVWFFLCATVELAIGIIVACLVSYHALYKTEKKNSVKSNSNYKTYLPGSGKHSQASRKIDPLQSYNDSYANAISAGNPDKNRISGSGSETRLTSYSNSGNETIPLDIINVENRYEVVHSQHP
ncbi:hypothetical protein G7Y89_g3385 [Cudoniella acicularis]|uniref:Rhodopsin domain-containing protein n=1 Tax=Cudoniella acicularis TaxID=354080 RepID=A0A8H4RRG8_9HELO|nr:hypothetical protein G7Y89_g3385 [Cudoniella acicularis]